MPEQPRIMELLDNYGWASDQEDGAWKGSKPHALLQWMTEVSNQLVELQYKLEKLVRDLNPK